MPQGQKENLNPKWADMDIAEKVGTGVAGAAGFFIVAHTLMSIWDWGSAKFKARKAAKAAKAEETTE